MPGRAGWDGYAFSLDGADRGRLEDTQRVWTDLDSVASVDDARLDDTGDDGTNERDREGIVDVELEGRVGVVVAVMGENVEEFADEVKAFAGDVRDLKDGTYPLADELSL